MPLVVKFLACLLGAALFFYGRRQRRPAHMVIGVLMAIGPMFVPGLVIPIIVTVALIALLVVLTRLGL